MLMIFLDGVGIGSSNSQNNPFFKYHFKFLKDYFGEIPHLKRQHISKNNAFIFPVDACLGVPGIPLSGTGQTSIFCGVNAPKLIGKHFGPFPYSTLIPVIKEKNIFKAFIQKKLKADFVNAYPKIFFDYINKGKKRLSVTSLSCLLSGIKLKGVTEVRRGKALTAEIDNRRWVEKLNYNLPIIKPKTAAQRLLKLALINNFTLFEYFLTDHLGHGRISSEFEYVIQTLDDFLFFLLNNLPPNLTLIICSDHGNFEDLSTKSHTLNPALTITAGKHAAYLSKKIKKLYHIKKAIMDIYS
ncbi:metalloenzyme [Melioribacteraceae bacterium 4301-Me]|uniref:metalloenzyme n=1 Tax=Pyranulibacter aquaticus TaxID=3163344 RepID=UPI003598C992